MVTSMAKAKRQRAVTKSAPVAAPRPSRWAAVEGWRAPAILAAAVILFYWIPLTDPNTSIQWDAVDVHYSAQKYFADHLHAGQLPFWTPYIFSGFPFLADIQVGAWYPLNWPFFLAGITPEAIQIEIALHALVACLGAFFLLARFARSRTAALVGAVAYAFTGYFTDHASHVGMFQAASLLPWLLLAFHEALERATVRFTILGGFAGGIIILAGHFQNALYCFLALGLFAIAMLVLNRQRWLRVIAALAGIGIFAVGLSAVATLPGLELTRNSIRGEAEYSTTHERILTPASLAGAVLPIDAGGIPAEGQTGGIHAGFYLYLGLLVLPLAALGLRDRRARTIGLLLIVPPVWYMLGPDALFYRLVVLLPGLGKIRAPIHMWFVAALGCAVLATAGISWLEERRPQWRWMPLAICAVLFADLFYWNSLANVRLYARNSFDDLYGSREELARTKVVPLIPPLARYDQPDVLTVFGPLNHPLDLHLETTYGYNPLQLSAYAEYRDAMKHNPKLRAGLNVARYLDVQAGGTRPEPDPLPRIYFAHRLTTAATPAESRRLLATLDPRQQTIVSAMQPEATADAQSSVLGEDEEGYRIHYRSSARALLVLAVPYFPGWHATVNGDDCPIVHANHALMGIVVPSGEHELLVRFHQNWFAPGAALSTAAALVGLALVLWRKRSRG